MDSKDLFDAINIAAEDYVSDLPDNTEGLRPIVLHADKKPRSVKRIVFGAAACAAAVAVIGVSVTVGMKNYSQRSSLVSNSSDSAADNIERNFAPAAEILRIRDVGFYTEDMYSYFLGYNKYREEIEKWYSQPMSKEALDNPIPVSSYLPPQPDVYYFNDIALDERMLSNEAYGFLSRYCLLSEEDRAGETVPDEVKCLTGSGFVRFGDVGYLRDKYTVEQLEECEKSCDQYRELNFYSSRIPLMPDVYYYNDIPYHLDQILSEDTQNWLKWYCWLDEETQEALGGYVPEEMEGRITACNSEKPPEIVTYKGRVFDVRSVSYDTEKYIKWYNSLSDNLKAKVMYEPQELSKIDGEKIIWNDREIVRFGDLGYYTDLHSEEEMAAIEKCYYDQMLNSAPMSPDVHFFNDTPYDTDKLSDETLSWLGWYYFCSSYIENPAGYVPSELIAPTEPLVRAEVYYFRGLPIKESELSDDTIRWLNWFNTLSVEEQYSPCNFSNFYVPSELSEYREMHNPIPAGADPDDPLPYGMIGPDGVELTYRDAAYGYLYAHTDQHIGLDKLEPGMMLGFDFVYLAEPGSSEFKRYKTGDSFYGMTVEQASASFTLEDDGTVSYQGDVWLSGSLIVDAYIVSEDTDKADCNEYRGAVNGLPHIGFSRDKDSGEAVPFDFTISQLINSGDNYAAAPGSITTDKDKTLPLNKTFKITLNYLSLWGTDSSGATFAANAAMSD